MKRRIASVGDTLSSGGTVLPAGGPPMTFMGHQVALVGGQAFCTACKSNGVIAKSGGPYRIQFVAEIALDGDIVMCKCPRPPRIIATLSGESWCDDDLGGSGQQSSSGFAAAGVAAAGAVASTLTKAYDEQVKVTADGPEGYPYYVETTDGRVFQGKLDASGMLPRIHTGHNPDDYTVYWGDDAIAKQNET
ncbi:hypothetical protein WM26_01905 [Burkholderia cepacia]|uniref:PAAR domain-containing protein n=2 Tax=Burkholderia cepacia TaxID=292 RepID=UPI00075FD2D8|nr:PAAR domain-containing protein [Burkholderia cepacia]KWO11269.1 hypothetical protein WM26_01905 [Burkholderia cepacia]